MCIRSVILPILAVILLVSGAWIYAAFRSEIESSKQRLIGRSTIIQTSSGPIEYAESGEGSVILAVHGAGGGFDQGLDILGPLADRGFRIIAISRFGYLRTAMPVDASPEAQADAHAALLDALGVKSATIYGVSAGGPSALQFAIRHPERCNALILMVPITYRPRQDTDTKTVLPPTTQKLLMTIVGSDFVYWLTSKLAPDAILKTAMGTPSEIVAAAHQNEQIRVKKFMRHLLPISSRARGIMHDSQMSQSIKRYPIEAINAPTLLLSARDDLYSTYANAEFTASHIKGAKFVGYETGGHMLVGHNDHMLSEIEMFLQSNTLSTSSRPNAEDAP
jgi:2-hydroxy-6-oxonona-2,4-dienedioate hydrolase